MKIILVAGARPNFIKIGPIMHEFKNYPEIEPILVHTGQHYDERMSKVFFDDLDIPKPDINLEVGSGSHAWQTAQIMILFEKVILEEKPDLVMVVGDVNSTIACSLTAIKMNIKIAHVEAGLRSKNWEMPEEINRVLTDRMSDFLLTTSRGANKNLLAEGIDKKKIFFVGNTMIDSLKSNIKIAENSDIMEKLGLTEREYSVLTLHRPANVDKREKLERILDILDKVLEQTRIVYPIHPRTRNSLKKFNLMERMRGMSNLKLTEPLGYHDFLKLISHAKMVLTDSGGIQEETTILGVPCLTMRDETERPVTITQGTNEIVGFDEVKIINSVNSIINGTWKKGTIPELWDGNTSERIIKVIKKEMDV